MGSGYSIFAKANLVPLLIARIIRIPPVVVRASNVSSILDRFFHRVENLSDNFTMIRIRLNSKCIDIRVTDFRYCPIHTSCQKWFAKITRLFFCEGHRSCSHGTSSIYYFTLIAEKSNLVFCFWFSIIWKLSNFERLSTKLCLTYL